MKISIQTKALKEALIKAKAIPGAVETVPLSGLVKIVADMGGTSFLRNTSMAFISVQSESEVEEEGETILDFSKLLGLAQNVAQETITLETTEKGTKASYGKHFANFGKIVEEGLKDNHLEEEGQKELTFTAKEIKKWCKDCMVASCQDVSRPAICGLILQTYGNSTYASGTDGRRIHATLIESKDKLDLLIPLEAAKSLQLISAGEEEDSEITMGIGEQTIRIATASTILRTKKIESNPPNLSGHFGEKGFHTEVTIKPKDAFSALKSAMIFSEGEQHRVLLEITPKVIEIKTNTAESGDSQHEIACIGKSKVKDKFFKFYANCQFIMDAIGIHSEEEKVTLRFNDHQAMYIIDEDSVAVLMGMRVE